MRKTLVFVCVLLAVASFLSSCARGISPYEAANGKARCGRYVR
jgi:hypothetical protein